MGPEAVDKVSGLFTMGYAMGEVSGPVLGGIAYDAFGFAWMCVGVSAVTFGYGLLILTLLRIRVVPKSGAEFD